MLLLTTRYQGVYVLLPDPSESMYALYLRKVSPVSACMYPCRCLIGYIPYPILLLRHRPG